MTIEQMDSYGYWLRLGKHIETANKSAECQKSWKAFEIIKSGDKSWFKEMGFSKEH